MNPSTTNDKPGRGQFKCYQCRKIYASKDGDWYTWENMEVHLCKACDKSTQTRPERKIRKSH